MAVSAPPGPPLPLRLSPEAAQVLREEIRRAGGREVSFLADVGEDRMVRNPRAVARGNRQAVLAVSRQAPPGSLMIHNHPSGNLEPSEADLEVAAALSAVGVGTAIVDNDARQLYVVVEPPAPRPLVSLDLEELEGFLGPKGGLARLHPAYEDRPGQREMAVLVGRCYNEGGVALVEAGTGTGKSAAYLLPALLWARRNQERTVVSTNTINLQEQLISKDLPLLDAALGGGYRWTLLKGRANYISIRRALLARDSAPWLLSPDRAHELETLVEWMGRTRDGSLSDLPVPPSEEVWEEVQSDADACLKARCPHFQECFYQRARREAAAAEVLVVNHHLLLVDLAVRRATNNYTEAAVLPPYRRLILDEAHNLEEAATRHLGVQVTRKGLHRLLSRLDRQGKGVLWDLMTRLEGDLAEGAGQDVRALITDRILPALADARRALDPFLEEVAACLPRGGEDSAVRLGGEGGVEPVREPAMAESLDRFLWSFRALSRELGELRARLQDVAVEASELAGRLLDVGAVEARLEAAARGVEAVLNPGEGTADWVRWLSWRGTAQRGERNLALEAAPVEVGPLLRDSLFGRVDTAVLTSATLTTQTGFRYIRERLGLEAEAWEETAPGKNVLERVVPSPFRYEDQTLLAVPTDLAAPEEEKEKFQEDTARVVTALAGISGGGLLVLFTSHQALRRVAQLLGGARLPGPLFVQGTAPRSRLLEDFTASGNGILLGTSSFWEGVDVPGDPLRGLVLQKLPFQVPTDPVAAARMERIRSRGEDPFWRLTLPEAALRLKQGFGRLIRTATDRGVVLLLDRRILTRRYGPYLRRSLPPVPLIQGPWAEVERSLRAFYSCEGASAF